MCGRFSLYLTEDIKDRFDFDNPLPELNDRYNIAPSQKSPVVFRNSSNQARMMKWGLIPFWAKNQSIGYKMINARVESVARKSSFRKAFESQRCLVPASGFYEWQTTKEGKIPYYLYLKGHKLFAMAGLYDIWQDNENKLYTFTIITTESNNIVEPIHNRMPAVLVKKDENVWLDKDTDDSKLKNLLKPYNKNDMQAYQVSKQVNNPDNDNKEIIKSTNPNLEKIQPNLL
jgi:putative SOS response-associated peptidase YedK